MFTMQTASMKPCVKTIMENAQTVGNQFSTSKYIDFNEYRWHLLALGLGHRPKSASELKSVHMTTKIPHKKTKTKARLKARTPPSADATSEDCRTTTAIRKKKKKPSQLLKMKSSLQFAQAYVVSSNNNNILHVVNHCPRRKASPLFVAEFAIVVVDPKRICCSAR